MPVASQPLPQTARDSDREGTDQQDRHVGLQQTYDLRQLTYDTAMALKVEPLAERESRSARAQAIAAVVRGFDTMVHRARLLKGRPWLGTEKPEKSAKFTRPTRPEPRQL